MSPRVSLGRVAAVTAALIGIGVVVGAAIGAALMLALAMVWGGGTHESFSKTLLDVLTFGGSIGAVIGAIAAPLLAWIFLRRVSLGRAIGETAIGTLIGGLLGVAVPPLIVPGALAGFLTAGIALYVRTRRTSRAGERTLLGGRS